MIRVEPWCKGFRRHPIAWSAVLRGSICWSTAPLWRLDYAPHEAAVVAYALGCWFGGQAGHAFIIWERNGPGMGLGHEIVRLR